MRIDLYEAYLVPCGTKIGEFELQNQSAWIVDGCGKFVMEHTPAIAWFERLNAFYGEKNIKITRNSQQIVIHQFDSCSYDELTLCLRARIESIREYTKFLHDEETQVYLQVRWQAIIGTVRAKFEIRRLLKMRRVLKRSGHKNWNSDVLSI